MQKIMLSSRSYLQRCIDKIVFNKEFLKKDTIMISGSPRSGTTWLMDIISTLPDYLTLFEPFNIIWFPIATKYGIKPRIYLNINIPDNNIKNYLNNIFTGMIKSSYPHYKLQVKEIIKRINATKLIVKFIRVNRLLPWISTYFNLRSIFLIVRHPCATISSQIKSGTRGYFLPKGIMPSLKDIIKECKNIEVLNNMDIDIIKKIKKINSEVELLSVIWSIDHYIPFMVPNSKPWITISYEKLLLKGNEEINRIFKLLNEEKIINNAIKKLYIPSITTYRSDKKKIFIRENQLIKWKTQLTENQIKKISNILGWFNITFKNSSYSILDNNFP